MQIQFFAFCNFLQFFFPSIFSILGWLNWWKWDQHLQSTDTKDEKYRRNGEKSKNTVINTLKNEYCLEIAFLKICLPIMVEKRIYGQLRLESIFLYLLS